MTSVLLAEDDDYLSNGLQKALKKRGYTVTAVDSGTDAQAILHVQNFDIFLLDVGLPGLDGTSSSVSTESSAQRLKEAAWDFHSQFLKIVSLVVQSR